MTDDFDVKAEFCTQPYLFEPEYSDQELREMTKNTLELTLFVYNREFYCLSKLYLPVLILDAGCRCFCFLLLYQFSVLSSQSLKL